MAMLSIRCLGRFEMADGAGNAIELQSGRHKLLVSALALSPGHAASRRDLMHMLWGDRGPDQARGGLRQAVWAMQNPVGYAPQYGGYCADGLAYDTLTTALTRTGRAFARDT